MVLNRFEQPTSHEASGGTMLAQGATFSVADANSALWDTRSAAATATIPPDVHFLRTAGYAAVGDGGKALYKRIAVPGSSQAWQFQSADGAWWELAETSINVLMFGASSSSTAVQNQTAFQNALNFARDSGIDVFVPAGDYELDPIIVENVRLYGAGSQDVGYDSGTPGIGHMGRGGTQLRITHQGSPAVSLRWGSSLEGINFYYPNQTKAYFDAHGVPAVYPATIFCDSNMVQVRIKNVGMVNSYVGIKIGDPTLNGNASGRVYIEGFLGYCIYRFLEITEARDIVHVSNSIVSYAHWNGTEAGSASVAGTIANWTYRNGAFIFSDTCDGLSVDNCFIFCYRRGFDIACSNPNFMGSPGLTQFMLVSNTLFDGTPQVLEVRDGGWITTTGFSNCVFTHLGAAPFDNSGEYPDQIYINSGVNQGGRLSIDNCYFSGAAGGFITIANNSLEVLNVTNCDFFASHRAAGAGAAGVYGMIYLANGGRGLRATFTGCTFDGSATGGILYAIAAEAAKSLSVVGGNMEAFVQPLFVNNLDAVTISGLTTRNTGGTYAIAFAGNFAGKLNLDANLDKPAQRYSINRPYAVGQGFPNTIAPTGTVITFSSKAIDATGALNGATGKFTCPSNGRYRATLQITGTVVAGDTWRFDLRVNGVIVRCVLVPISISGLQTLPSAEFEFLGAAGQTVDIRGSRFIGTGTFNVLYDNTLNGATFELVQ